MSKQLTSVLFFITVCITAIVISHKVVIRLGESDDLYYTFKLMTLGFVALFCALFAIFRYQQTMAIAPYLVIFMIANTGFTRNLPVGHTSVLEVITFGLAAITLIKSAANKASDKEILFINKQISIYLLIAFVGIITALIFEVRKWNIFVEVKSYTLYLVYIYLLVKGIKTFEQIEKCIWFTIIVSLFPLYHGLFGSMASSKSLNPFFRPEITGWGALNLYVGYIVGILVLAVTMVIKYRNWLIRLLLSIYSLLILYTIVFSQTRTGWITTIVCSVFLGVLLRKKWAVVTTALLLIIIAVSSPIGDRIYHKTRHRAMTLMPGEHDRGISERLHRAKAAIATARRYPITGAGWGSYLPLDRNGKASDTTLTLLPRWHNSYLEILSQIGIPGLIAFLMIWYKIFSEAFSQFRSKAIDANSQLILGGLMAMVLSFLLYATGEQQFYRIDHASYTWFWTGMLVAAIQILKRQKTGEARVETLNNRSQTDSKKGRYSDSLH